MQSKISLFILSFFLCIGLLKAAPGDSTVVQTFTFGSKQDSTFKFPDQSKEYSKILMYYTLKCNPAQNPACGEWDYLTYTYLYQHTGVYDSVVKRVDTLRDGQGNVTGVDTVWGQKERLKRFELSRYITPYGKGIDLGSGFTWIFDVSDYAPLLHDSVHLAAGNWQELLDLKFVFIEGKPARKPYKVENVWTGNFPYGTSKSIEEYLAPKKITIDPKAAEVRMKIRITGHGFGGTDNCSEFCPRNHELTVDGSQVWTKLVWRDNCAFNPIPAQGGTWLYQRANWCPGAEVETYNVELTPYVQAGKEATIDYNIDPYTWNGQGSQPYYATEIQMVYYEAPAYNLDASIEDVVSPSSANMHQHQNPACGAPEIVIQNNGKTTLTSLRFTYGIPGGTAYTYDWKGELPYLQKAHVMLPAPYYAGSGFPTFKVAISNPNGGTDENAVNDVAYSTVPRTQVLDTKFIVYLRTNSKPEENAYYIKDPEGHVLFSRENMVKNTLYKDTITLPNGCFTFQLTDAGEDGLSWWANTAAGNGYVRITNMSNKVLKSFNPDFGAEILFNFNTGWGLSVEDKSQPVNIGLYPNPSTGNVAVDYSMLPSAKGTVRVYTTTGKLIRSIDLQPHASELKLDMQNEANGVYIVQVMANGKVYSQKLMLMR